MREDDVVRLSLQCARLAVTGARYESALADGVAAILRTDAGTGVTHWYGNAGSPVAEIEVVVSGVPPISREYMKAALAVVPRHPTFTGRGLFSRPTHRISDSVDLPTFWDTDVWRAMHGHGNGRYPAAVILAHHRHATVFVGVHRTCRDFDADDMVVLDLIREPLAAALAFRAAWQDSIRRCRMSIEGPISDPFTKREEQILGLVALGWTNSRIGRHLQISERTVRKHLENLNDKLGTSNRASLIHQWHTRAGSFDGSCKAGPGS